MHGNASGTFTALRSRGVVSGGLPRYGDLVFLDVARPFGNTAIYIGGTSIVTTQGMNFDRLPVAVRDLSSFPNYLSWASV